jgi:hypothetical protein
MQSYHRQLMHPKQSAPNHLLHHSCDGNRTAHVCNLLQLLRAGGDSPLHAVPLWCRPGLSDAGLVAEFRREARVVRKGMDGDLIKVRGIKACILPCNEVASGSGAMRKGMDGDLIKVRRSRT